MSKKIDIEKVHTGWITTNQPLLIPCDDIESVEQKSIKIDSELDGAMLVRINLKSNQIHLICADENDWNKTFEYYNRNANIVKLGKSK